VREGTIFGAAGCEQSTFNKVIGRPEPKNQSTEGDSWLAGRRARRQPPQDPESKKVFSFKEPSNAQRTFGFVNPDIQISGALLDFNEIRRRLKEVWPDFQDSEFIEGQTILQSLLSSASGGTP
jgi:hypothetical protein